MLKHTQREELDFPNVENSASSHELTESGSGAHTAQTEERLQVFTTKSGGETTTPPLKNSPKIYEKNLKDTFCVNFI